MTGSLTQVNCLVKNRHVVNYWKWCKFSTKGYKVIAQQACARATSNYGPMKSYLGNWRASTSSLQLNRDSRTPEIQTVHNNVVATLAYSLTIYYHGLRMYTTIYLEVTTSEKLLLTSSLSIFGQTRRRTSFIFRLLDSVGIQVSHADLNSGRTPFSPSTGSLKIYDILPSLKLPRRVLVCIKEMNDKSRDISLNCKVAWLKKGTVYPFYYLLTY